MGRYNIRKLFRKSTTSKQIRLNLIGEWLADNLSNIDKKSGDSIIATLKLLDVEARSFTRRTIHKFYSLDDNWFRCVIAQVMVEKQVPHLQVVYDYLGWGDVNWYLNPKYDDNRTIERFDFFQSKSEDLSVKLLLQHRSHTPLGSIWEHKITGARWKVNWVYEDEDKIEIESQVRGYLDKVNENYLMKRYRRVK